MAIDKNMENMKGKLLPNPFPLPLIHYEELWDKPLMLPGYEYDWDRRVSVSDRLYHHNTLASIRWNRKLKAPCAPKDSLDFMLSTIYDHGIDSFPETNFVYVQPENIGLPSYKLLRNVRFVPEVRPARDLQEDDQPDAQETVTQEPGTKWHGIKIGGIKERLNVNNVKLGLSSYHGPQSNAGFSRKIDGSYYGS